MCTFDKHLSIAHHFASTLTLRVLARNDNATQAAANLHCPLMTLLNHHADAAGPPQLLLNLKYSAKMAHLQLTLWAVCSLLQAVLSLMLCQRHCVLALHCFNSLTGTLQEVGMCHKLPHGRNRQARLEHLI